MATKIYYVGHLAEYYKRKKSTIYAWIKNGKLPPKKDDGVYYLTEEQLDYWESKKGLSKKEMDLLLS